MTKKPNPPRLNWKRRRRINASPEEEAKAVMRRVEVIQVSQELPSKGV